MTDKDKIEVKALIDATLKAQDEKIAALVEELKAALEKNAGLESQLKELDAAFAEFKGTQKEFVAEKMEGFKKLLDEYIDEKTANNNNTSVKIEESKVHKVVELPVEATVGEGDAAFKVHILAQSLFFDGRVYEAEELGEHPDIIIKMMEADSPFIKKLI